MSTSPDAVDRHETTARGAGSRRVVAWLRAHWFVLSCMAVAAVVAVVVRDQVFPHYGANRDEPVYVLQAQAIRAGHFTLPEYRDLQFFQPWLTGVVDGRLIFEFPPGWPAFLAFVLLVTGSMVPALPIVAALAVLGLYALAREASGRPIVGSVAAVVAVFTPMIVVQSGLLLSYLFTLAVGCLAGTAFLRGAKTGRSAWFVVAGALLGAILVTRPFDALLWSVPFAIYIVVRARGGSVAETVGRALRRLGWVVVGLAPAAICLALYNQAVTGSPTRFPIEAADPLNTFGFGERRIMRGTALVAYSGHDALDAMGENFRHAPPWVLGSWIGVGLAVAGAIVARRRGSTYVLLGLIVTFGFGYLFYWGLALMGAGAVFGGPQYYLPMIVPIVVLGATALVAAWEWRRVVGVVLGVAVLAVSVPTIFERADENRAIETERFDPERETIRDFRASNALVFVPTEENPFILAYLPFAANPPDLDDDQIFAVDLAPDLVDLVDRTTRTPYRLFYENTDGPDGQVTTTRMRRLHTRTASAFRIAVRVTNPGDAALVTAYLETPAGVEEVVVDHASAKGAAYDVEWTVAAPSASTTASVTMPEGLGWLTVGVRFGPTPPDGDATDSHAVSELRYATRTIPATITAVLPARRFGPVDTVYGRLMLETPPHRSLQARLVESH